MGDTDLFPRPFELDAIAYSEEGVVDYLKTIEIESYNWVGGIRTIVPKGMTSFRPAMQLDPIDSLILAGIIYQFGSKIEQGRLGKEEVFSYRFEPTEDGYLYDTKSSWKKFWDSSSEKAHGKWVVVADVASYYSHISHSAIEEQLGKDSAELPPQVVTSIMRLLDTLAGYDVRQGIPVGPHSVHLLAECAFNPIDQNLKRDGYDFCRYVDNIHIFCETKDAAYACCCRTKRSMYWMNLGSLVSQQINIPMWIQSSWQMKILPLEVRSILRS
jgi:hypothetical protein